jgi:hypothetical protein
VSITVGKRQQRLTPSSKMKEILPVLWLGTAGILRSLDDDEVALLGVSIMQ